MEEAENLCSRVAIIDKGHIINRRQTKGSYCTAKKNILIWKAFFYTKQEEHYATNKTN